MWRIENSFYLIWKQNALKHISHKITVLSNSKHQMASLPGSILFLPLCFLHLCHYCTGASHMHSGYANKSLCFTLENNFCATIFAWDLMSKGKENWISLDLSLASFARALQGLRPEGTISPQTAQLVFYDRFVMLWVRGKESAILICLKSFLMAWGAELWIIGTHLFNSN